MVSIQTRSGGEIHMQKKARVCYGLVGWLRCKWWQASVWVTKRIWCHLLWIFKTVAKTFGPVVTSYISITAATVKLYANLNSGKGLGRIFFVILTLGSAWSKKTKQTNCKNVCQATDWETNLNLLLYTFHK